MRDLDQIQERDGDDRGRKLGTVLLATASVVGLTFAMGVVVGRAAEPDAPAPKDPLDQLAPGAGLGDAAEQTPTAKAAPPKVEPTELSFPNTLTEEEDRPEVLAALRAAALEEAALAQPPGAVPGQQAAAANAAAVPAAVAAAITAAEPQGIRFSDAQPEAAAAPQELVTAVPAAVAAGSTGETLHHSAQHDPMVKQALEAEEAPKGPRAPKGMMGEWTLQVISYDSPAPANAFADGLRDKGHEAFVVKADIPERGRFFRVRIGPFKSRHRAEVYRRKFEQEERMNTFVVRTKPDNDG